MKKQFTLLFLVIISYSSWSQPTVRSETPCNDEFLFRIPGRWLNKELNDLGSKHLGLNQAQIKEITNRINAIHQIVFSIYPRPMGIDAVWHPVIGYSTFAEQVKYSRNNQNILVWDPIVAKPVAGFTYTSGYFRYYCNPNNSNELFRGYPGETRTWFHVYANDFTRVAPEIFRSGDMPDTMTIDGSPVHLLEPPIKTIGDFVLRGIDYETAHLSTRGIERFVLIHRRGMLPYIPVTRKQYLDRCIHYVKYMYEMGLKFLKESPLPYNDKENQEIRDKQIQTSIKSRDFAVKRYQEELNKNSREGTLELPAIVTSVYDNLIIDKPIFVDEAKGLMLVIENPNYMRADLPKYVPQFFLVEWTWGEWKPEADFSKLIEENFPFEKLLAMIDK